VLGTHELKRVMQGLKILCLLAHKNMSRRKDSTAGAPWGTQARMKGDLSSCCLPVPMISHAAHS
jgi:hypothetical protein